MDRLTILVTDEVVGKGSQGEEEESVAAPLAAAVEVRPNPRLPVAIRPMLRGESKLALACSAGVSLLSLPMTDGKLHFRDVMIQ